MEYYYSLNNQPMGPVPLERLHELYRSGEITLETLVVPIGGTEWKAYSTLNSPPSAGQPSAPGGSEPTTPTPTPTEITTTTPASPASFPHAAAATLPPPGYKNFVVISWALLGVTALLSVIPIVGCISWVMLIPVFITAVILAVLTIQRGGTTQGVLILIAAVVVLPLFTLLAPIVTTALFGAITGLDKAESSPNSPTPPAVKTSPAPATRPPAAGSAGLTTETPNETVAKQMVNNTMSAFKDAVNTGDFDPFYRTQVSERWKKEVSPEKLKAAFKAFIDRGVDLTPIFSVEPVLDEPPYVDGNGLLTLVGHYPVPSENVNVAYELSYSPEAKWALSAINVNIKPHAP